MVNDGNSGSGAANANTTSGTSSFAVKAGLAQMLKGGVIMDVVNAEQVYPDPSAGTVSADDQLLRQG